MYLYYIYAQNSLQLYSILCNYSVKLSNKLHRMRATEKASGVRSKDNLSDVTRAAKETWGEQGVRSFPSSPRKRTLRFSSNESYIIKTCLSLLSQETYAKV